MVEIMLMKIFILKITLLCVLFTVSYSGTKKNAFDTCNEYHRLGIEYFEHNEFDKALEYLNEATKIDSNCDNAYYLKGEIYISKKSGFFDLFRAAEEFEKAIRIKPKFAEYYYDLSSCFFIAGNQDAYFLNIHKAFEIDPNNLLLFYGHASHCYTYKLSDSVIHYCTKIINSMKVENSLKIMSYILRAKCYIFLLAKSVKQEKISENEKELKIIDYYVKAQNDLGEVFKLNANEPEALYYQGIISYYSGSYQNVIDECNDALNYIINHPSYYYLIDDINSLINAAEKELNK